MLFSLSRALSVAAFLVTIASTVDGVDKESGVSSSLSRYIMWIPGRGGSTWVTEMLARSHPDILAHKEIFSGQSGKNLLGSGHTCGDGKESVADCLRALKSYWSSPNDLTKAPVAQTLPPSSHAPTWSNAPKPPPPTSPAVYLAKGFKVRPTVGWASKEMRRAYDDSKVRFVCNTRVDTLRHGISMYRHGLSRGQTKSWTEITRLYGKSEYNNTRVTIPSEILSKGDTDDTGRRLKAECTINIATYTNRWGRRRQQNIWLSDCAQNITYAMFDYVYARADRLMKAVNSICLDFVVENGGAVHWLNYEKTQFDSRAEIDALANFLIPGVKARTESNAAETGVSSGGNSSPERHKTSASRSGGFSAFMKSVPNIADIAAAWWNRSKCATGKIAETILPLAMHGSGGIPSTHSIKSLLFDDGQVAKRQPRGRPGIGGESPFVTIGSGLHWLGDLFAKHPEVRHAVIKPSDEKPTHNPGAVRCDGGCDLHCQQSIQNFVLGKESSVISSSGSTNRDKSSSMCATGISVAVHSLMPWNTSDATAHPLILKLAARKTRLVCAVWENAIQGGLARLHETWLVDQDASIQAQCATARSTGTTPLECKHVLTKDAFLTAVNAVALETFATLRFCHAYANSAGEENVYVVAHRPDEGIRAPTTALDNLALFLGVSPWDSKTAAAHLMGSYHSFFPGLLEVLRETIHAEAHLDRDASTNERLNTMCTGCDAYSVADTLDLLL